MGIHTGRCDEGTNGQQGDQKARPRGIGGHCSRRTPRWMSRGVTTCVLKLEEDLRYSIAGRIARYLVN
jgi:hypothetical protein